MQQIDNNWTCTCGYDGCGCSNISLFDYDGHQTMIPFSGTPSLPSLSFASFKTLPFRVALPAVPGAPDGIAPLPCNPPARRELAGQYSDVSPGNFISGIPAYEDVPINFSVNAGPDAPVVDACTGIEASIIPPV